MSWIVKGEILALSSPVDSSFATRSHNESNSSGKIADLLNKLGVKSVVRLNEALYDRSVFVDSGMKHYDLPFDDGSCPPSNIVAQFVEIAKSAPKPIAIHCKAGFGRTGTLVCLYLYRFHSISMKTAVAWCKVCRPGSIIQSQFNFLVEYEQQQLQTKAPVHWIQNTKLEQSQPYNQLTIDLSAYQSVPVHALSSQKPHNHCQHTPFQKSDFRSKTIDVVPRRSSANTESEMPRMLNSAVIASFKTENSAKQVQNHDFFSHHKRPNSHLQHQVKTMPSAEYDLKNQIQPIHHLGHLPVTPKSNQIAHQLRSGLLTPPNNRNQTTADSGPQVSNNLTHHPTLRHADHGRQHHLPTQLTHFSQFNGPQPQYNGNLYENRFLLRIPAEISRNQVQIYDSNFQVPKATGFVTHRPQNHHQPPPASLRPIEHRVSINTPNFGFKQVRVPQPFYLHQYSHSQAPRTTYEQHQTHIAPHTPPFMRQSVDLHNSVSWFDHK